MQKLTVAKQIRRTCRLPILSISLAAVIIVAGAIRRDIFGVLSLTTHYLSDLPVLFGAYASAFTAAISWPSIAASIAILALGAGIWRTRRSTNLSQNTARYALGVGALAIGLSLAGFLSSPSHAAAQQEALRRKLNARGHIEVIVDDASYELNANNKASDTSIRNQALIEQLRSFNISAVYPQLANLNHDGLVAKIRSVHTEGGCIYYVERRFEPALNKIVDANASCVRTDANTYAPNSHLEPLKTPAWKVGQAIYLTYAKLASNTAGDTGFGTTVIVQLPGKADDYIAHQYGDKVVPKGQPGTGMHSCGINWQDTCPDNSNIDVFTNAPGHMASGEIGSSIPGDSLPPRPNSAITEFFGKITALSNSQLELKTTKGQQLAISWPTNVIAQFNANGALNYSKDTADGSLAITTGDSLTMRVWYADGMDLGHLSLSDVEFIGLALKPAASDPLDNSSYKSLKTAPLQKY